MNINHILIMCIFAFLFYSMMTCGIFQEHYVDNDPALKDVVNTIRPLFKKKNYTGLLSPINNRDIIAELNFNKSDQSYTLNKSDVHVCLKDKNGKYYNKNMLIYVVLHELSHVICDEIGHTPKFDAIFAEILDEATKMKIYNPSIPLVQNYCPL